MSPALRIDRGMPARLLRALEFCLLAFVAWQVAGLFWLLAAPATGGPALVPVRQAPAQAPSRDALLRWFGADAGAEAAFAGDFSLLAVVAGERGAALLRGGDGISVAVRVGDEIRPGARLLAVEPGGIRIDERGRRRELKLPETTPSTVAAASR